MVEVLIGALVLGFFSQKKSTKKKVNQWTFHRQFFINDKRLKVRPLLIWKAVTKPHGSSSWNASCRSSPLLHGLRHVGGPHPSGRKVTWVPSLIREAAHPNMSSGTWIHFWRLKGRRNAVVSKERQVGHKQWQFTVLPSHENLQLLLEHGVAQYNPGVGNNLFLDVSFPIVCWNSFPFSGCPDLNKAHLKIQTMHTAHVEAVLDHPTWLCRRSSDAARNLGGHPQFSLLPLHCLSFLLQWCTLLHSHVGATERQINAHKEQERRKKARGIHWCTELPDKPSGGFKSFVSSRGFLWMTMS